MKNGEDGSDENALDDLTKNPNSRVSCHKMELVYLESMRSKSFWEKANNEADSTTEDAHFSCALPMISKAVLVCS